MNREIIFRAKCFGNWRYGCYLHFDKKPTNSHCNINYKDFIVTNDDDGEHYFPISDLSSIGQYTGLIDKNGKKIFEGDILQDELDSRINHIVKYDNSRCSYTGWCSLVHWNWEKGNIISQQWINECGKVVIGNIFDNKELIKQL